ncbi:hypothetical protein JCGZ_12478 [Jatropha curcas]|uniref:Cytochrome P450 n=1 Tax=Jatropha curcas TaxID=180498 RepID=A0A067K7C2_JATCU|nr:cytochrome P450 81Q32 [Jatropha curcas]KDP32017.1 hypothetical protein JCGZ_12478 [Jatropha curcas]
MEVIISYLYTSLSLLLLLFLSYKFYLSKTTYKNLPPSPPSSLPILGHLHLLKPPIHRFLQSLSQKYGPIISLKFGHRIVVVVSSPSAVEECFTKNDIVLANRPQFTLSKHINYNCNDIISVPYGDHWRNLRRIGTLEIFSTNRLNEFTSTRKDEIKRLLIELSRHSKQDFAEVELKSRFSNLTFNVILRMVAGKRYYGDDANNKEEAKEFRELIGEIFRNGGASHPEDFLPILSWINGGKLEKTAKGLAKRSNKFLQGLIDEHRHRKEGSEITDTMIDHLLSLQGSEPNVYTDDVIKGLIMIMLLAGTDTSSVTLEWAMSNLVNHPDTLNKAKIELDAIIGQEHLLEESDLSKLPYLHNIISETLRLYPSAPLLVPHFTSDDCTIGGYNVPRGTIVLVNAWAIHRDSSVWDDPISFKPERFEQGQTEAYKYLPFGLGRRACPGATMAQRVVGLTLGSLIQCFEWRRIDEKLVDMTEGIGISMPKAEPLKVMCKSRDIMNKVLIETS